MSESSESKTKRNFKNHLVSIDWKEQLSVFYINSIDIKNALSHKPVITDVLARMYPHETFLYRLCLKNTSGEMFEDISNNESLTASYHTIFSTCAIDKKLLQEKLESKLGVCLKLKKRKVDPFKIESYSKRVLIEKPHNLERFFSSDVKIRRWSLVGKQNAYKAS